VPPGDTSEGRAREAPTRGIARLDPRRGLFGLLFRLPIRLYHAGLGGLLGRRFLLLQVVGRRSGRAREVVLEVVSCEPASDRYVVAAAWGARSGWLRDLRAAGGHAGLQVGRRRFPAIARELSPDESASALTEYARRHRLAFRLFVGPLLLGQRPGPTPEAVERLAREVPLVELRPRGATHARS
jgi:deazaflavin-dependent oxidoreductase (nitroreductase family)